MINKTEVHLTELLWDVSNNQYGIGNIFSKHLLWLAATALHPTAIRPVKAHIALWDRELMMMSSVTFVNKYNGQTPWCKEVMVCYFMYVVKDCINTNKPQ